MTNKMNPYEKNEYTEIIKWENEPPSVVSQTINFVMKPVTWLVGKVIPHKAIQGALIASNYLAELATDSNDIKRDGEVNKIEDLRHKDLKLSDKLANEVHNWANLIASVEGAATGSAGLTGLIIDVPSLITMSLRVIHKIGLCYGYECHTEEDKMFVYGIMSAAGANTVEEKTISVATLQTMKVCIAKNTWKKITEKASTNKYGVEVAILTIKNLAKRLGINITKRKALQAIPIIGSGVGAAMNLAFINDIAWAARRSYQRRWLEDNDKIVVNSKAN